MTFQLQHSQLGQVEGVKHDNGVVEYRGIQYAIITNSFAKSTIYHQRANEKGPVNATRKGLLRNASI
ncbi:hypothetical protein N7493_001660 [Penicillium malachiteum]|uniref:Uncharacterized protein n=1 Tax=Penicillium malachiteum TaxID=1324776 RepID=A0AAD6HUJ8_9EURO|nr:hypothetical protein N7493_001660 [Penicillium malachiteum]